MCVYNRLVVYYKLQVYQQLLIIPTKIILFCMLYYYITANRDRAIKVIVAGDTGDRSGGGASLSFHHLFTMSLNSAGKRTAYLLMMGYDG